jgi:hypothetical protein
MSNFLTTPAVAAAFVDEIRDLAYSLTPGGVLLVLGGTGEIYHHVYAALDQIVDSKRGPHLKIVLDQDLQAQADSHARDVVASQIVQSLQFLSSLAPGEFEFIRTRLPPDVRDLRPESIGFPRFKARAYKREGRSALSKRERRRRFRRSSSDR